jgi:hypothetical protein
VYFVVSTAVFICRYLCRSASICGQTLLPSVATLPGWVYLSFLPIQFGFRASDFGFPALPGCGFVLTTALLISCVDIPWEPKRGSGPSAGHISGCAEPLYGTMLGPGCYQTATRVPRVRNLPFSLLRMLIQLDYSARADGHCSRQGSGLSRPGRSFARFLLPQLRTSILLVFGLS